MPYSVAYEAEAGYIAIVLNGTLDQSAAREVASEIVRLVQEHNCFLVLNDAREATLNLSIADIHELPIILSEMLVPSGLQLERLKRALVVPDAMNDFIFFETVSRVHGQNIMLFRDMDEARRWLVRE